VYWKFAVGTAEYETIVQCKDHKNSVDQGELLKFRSVLNDLAGQPKGIVVSRAERLPTRRRTAYFCTNCAKLTTLPILV
jgi:hypothetical protein